MEKITLAILVCLANLVYILYLIDEKKRFEKKVNDLLKELERLK